MIKFRKSEISALANKLTRNSELFSDEVVSVTSQLSELSISANQFGCNMEGKIATMWGGTVTVVAMPDVRRHSWSF